MTDTEASPARIVTTCCVVGGGPAGMMLGLLLARAGIAVTVLEKHADFLRDLRGDTIHPSTLELMHELGLLDAFLKLSHQKAAQLGARFGDIELQVADFSHLPTRCRFIALMPQWDFLNFLAQQGKKYPSFDLRMQAEATGLIVEQDAVTGIRADTPDGPLEIRADLTVAADGRGSVLRARAGMTQTDLGALIDVLWFLLPKADGDPEMTMGRFDAGSIFITIERGDYWQCAHVIPKGGNETFRARGLDAFRDEIARALPFAADRTDTIASWDDVKLLSVQVDRLNRWSRPGLLCIGDAAHAMSPVGGVGINLAIQDAVAAANLLHRPLRDGTADTVTLARVQRRRDWPTRMTQRLQVAIQNRIIARVLATGAPLPLRLLARYPVLRRIPARLVGLGFRPEHIRSPEVRPAGGAGNRAG